MQYALLDVSRVNYELERIQQLAPVWLSLYRGPEDAQQEEAAPCLVGYEPGDALAQWLAQNWGDSVGIGIETDVSPEELRKHLRRFLMVQLENDGRKVYFRYYDPNILRVFLPTCDPDQLALFFGPVRAFTAEDPERSQILLFTRHNDQLAIERVAVAAVS